MKITTTIKILPLAEAYAKNPDAIYLASGLTHADMLPFKQISVTFSDGSEKKLADAEVYSALQYGISRG